MKLLPGLDNAAPQIKGTLESWAQEMKTLDPVKDQRRMQELSDNIRSTVEANAARNVPAKPAIDPAVERDMKRLQAYDQMSKQKRAGDILTEGPQVRSSDDMKKLAAGFVADSPFAPGKLDPLTALNQSVDNTGKSLVNKYMADSSPENKAFAERAFRNVANPMNLIGGVGLADAAMGVVDTVIPDGTLDEGVKRFKGLFGK